MVMVTPSDVLIRLSDNYYPLNLEEVRQAHPLVSFGNELAEEDLTDLGYALVHDTERPEGDVVIELPPLEVDGVWQRQWQAREFDEGEIADRFAAVKADYFANLDRVVSAILAVGMPYTHNGQTIHVQLRGQDKINLLALQGKNERLVEKGVTDRQQIFRPYENETLMLTPQEMVDLCDKALSTMEAIYIKVWAIKDQADRATVAEELPPLPESLFD